MLTIKIDDPVELRRAKRAQLSGWTRELILAGEPVYGTVRSIMPDEVSGTWTVQIAPCLPPQPRKLTFKHFSAPGQAAIADSFIG